MGTCSKIHLCLVQHLLRGFSTTAQAVTTRWGVKVRHRTVSSATRRCTTGTSSAIGVAMVIRLGRCACCHFPKIALSLVQLPRNVVASVRIAREASRRTDWGGISDSPSPGPPHQSLTPPPLFPVRPPSFQSFVIWV